MCQFLDFNVLRNGDVLIVNKNLKEDSVTLKELNTLYRDIMREHYSKPSTPQLTIFFFACHGIDRHGVQHIVLNEFDKNGGFYSL